MNQNPLDIVYYFVLHELAAIDNNNLNESITRLVNYLNKARQNLEKTNLGNEIITLFIYLLAALCDRFILVKCVSSTDYTPSKQLIANSLEAQLFGTAAAGTQLTKNIKAVLDLNDYALARIYGEILSLDVFYGTYGKQAESIKLKFKLSEDDLSDPFKCIIKTYAHADLPLSDHLNYRFWSILALGTYLIASTYTWYAATGSL